MEYKIICHKIKNYEDIKEFEKEVNWHCDQKYYTDSSLQVLIVKRLFRKKRILFIQPIIRN